MAYILLPYITRPSRRCTRRVLYRLDYFCLCIFAWFSCIALVFCFNWFVLCCCGTHQMRRPSTPTEGRLLRFVWCIYITYTPTPLVAGKFPKGLVALLYLHRAIPCFILFYFFKVVDAINWYWLLSFWTFFFDAGATTTDQTRSPLRTSPTRWWWTPQTIITFWRQCQEIRQAVSSWPYCPVRVLITTWCTANTIQTFTITAVPVTRAAVIQLDTIIQVGVHFQVRLCRPFFGVYSIWLF